jgi:two-component system sensor histidine kinase HydH
MTTDTPAEPLAASKNPSHRARWAVLVVLVVAISLGHYLTNPEHFLLHNIYQRLYYIPVLLACAWYGLAGGLAVAAVCAACYAPHILLHWKRSQAYQANQIIELGMFGVVAFVAGALSDRERRLRLEAEALATERDRALTELKATVDGVRRADRLAALGTLTAGMAHEIRNPLGAIGGAAEILESDYPEDHPRREFLDILRREIARLNAIVGKYLDYARPQAPEFQPVDLNAAVHAAIELVGKSAAGASIALDARLAEGLPPVRADAGQIHQVLVNLLLNAVQAMPEGGTVEIATRVDEGSAVVEVRDHGVGLPEVATERLFEPFFTTKSAGTGLGLHVCRRIAQSHGGRLDAANAPGGGASFRLVLPTAGTEGAA